MRNKVVIAVKAFFMAVLSFLWFLFIQAEYEIVIKPELRDDLPFFYGMYSVVFTGFLLLLMAAAIVFLWRSIKKSWNGQENINRGAI